MSEDKPIEVAFCEMHDEIKSKYPELVSLPPPSGGRKPSLLQPMLSDSEFAALRSVMPDLPFSLDGSSRKGEADE